MPELPEVETIRRQLTELITGEVIGEVEVLDRKVFVGQEEALRGERVVKINRWGKYLLMHFASGRGVTIHLKMTGRMVVDNEKIYETAKHTRIKVRFASGKNLYYWDTRKFGYWQLTEAIIETEEKVKKKLGKEPWEMEVKEFLSVIKKSNRTIKDLILDQKIMAGVGNIYANDALFLAGINPHKRGRKMRKADGQKLLKAIRTVLERGLKTGGASDNSYVDAKGEKGSYQNEFLVYGKTKGICPKCGGPLRYTSIGGRGTWSCEKDQK